MMRALPAWALLLSLAPAVLAAQSPVETPSLEERVRAGDLPPVAERIPEVPSVVRLDGDKTPGRHGGQLRVLMGKEKDIRQIVVYGYARLLCYTPELDLTPDLLRRVDVLENRSFTLHLRPGHRWSDGHPFTSEDFRYYWEDIAQNPELSRSGPPNALVVDGELPTVEYPYAYTVRYSWSRPNPYCLPALDAP
jgi:peptide/nickel transport system substrate-binding protein